MLQLPTNSLASRALFGRRARRSVQARKLAFELLESRSLLTADLLVGPLATHVDTAGSSAAIITTTFNNLSGNNSDIRVDVHNATSPNSTQLHRGDQLLLRVLAGNHAANMAALSSGTQIELTFDPRIVAMEGAARSASGFGNQFLANENAGNRLTYFVYPTSAANSQLGEELLLEVPFRVIAEGEAAFAANATHVELASQQFVDTAGHRDVDLLQVITFTNLTAFSVPRAENVQFKRIAYDHLYGGPGRDQLAIVDGYAIKFEPRTVTPPWTPTSEPNVNSPPDHDPLPDHQPFAGLRALASEDSLPPPEPTRERSSWMLFDDATLNRHRPLLLGSEYRGHGLYGSRGNSSLGRTSLLFQDGGDAESSQSGGRRVTESRRESNLTDSSALNALWHLSSEGRLSRLLDDEANISPVTVLRSEDFDAVLAEWKERASPTEPKVKRIARPE